jgi:hypothetical protein
MAWRLGISAGIARGATGGGASAGALKDGTGSLAFFQVPTGKSNKKQGENHRKPYIGKKNVHRKMLNKGSWY